MKKVFLLFALLMAGRAWSFTPTATPTITPTWTPIVVVSPAVAYHSAGNVFQQDLSGAYAASLTFTAVGGAVNGVQLVPGMPGKIIMVVGWNISTADTADIIIHYGTGAVVKSNTKSTFIAGGYFAGGTGESGSVNLVGVPALSVGQGVSVDFGAETSKVYVTVKYIVY